jgi:hypothetical protein
VSAVGLHGKSRKKSSKRVLEQHRTFGQALTEIDNNEKSWGCGLKMFQKGSKYGKPKAGSKVDSKRVENIAIDNIITDNIDREKTPGYLSRQSRKDNLQEKLSNADLSENKVAGVKKKQPGYPKYLRQYSQHHSKANQIVNKTQDYGRVGGKDDHHRFSCGLDSYCCTTDRFASESGHEKLINICSSPSGQSKMPFSLISMNVTKNKYEFK